MTPQSKRKDYIFARSFEHHWPITYNWKITIQASISRVADITSYSNLHITGWKSCYYYSRITELYYYYKVSLLKGTVMDTELPMLSEMLSVQHTWSFLSLISNIYQTYDYVYVKETWMFVKSSVGSLTWWPPGWALCSWTLHRGPGTFPSPPEHWKA